MTGPRVAAFPARHAYLDAVLPAAAAAVGPPADPAHPWAPHPWWRPAGLAAAAPGVDVVHVHFGYDHLTPNELVAWLAQVRRSRLPLVVTVHDLRNPHHDRPERHRAHLDLLVPAADALLTLTPGAARAIAATWGREAGVLAHPTLLDHPPGLRPRRRRPSVGVHLKSLRRNVRHVVPVVRAAAEGARRTGAELQVNLHPDVADRPEIDPVRDLVEQAGGRVSVRDRFDDAELAEYLQDIDVSVLAQSFGTHSGWLELCRDLGTAVVAPDCGFYAEQWPAVVSYGNNEADGLDEQSLAAAVARAVSAGPPGAADPVCRRAARDEVRRAHGRLYQDLIARAT